MAIEHGAAEIRSVLELALQRNTGALIGRNGTIELETLFFYLSHTSSEYPQSIARRIELHAGVWPPTRGSLNEWATGLFQAIQSSDVLVAGWYAPLKDPEQKLLETAAPSVPRIPLRSLEPYYVPPELRWTQLLGNQRVAIVSAFAETIEEQLQVKDLVWPVASESLLPSSTTWIPIRTGYAPKLAQGVASWPSTIHTWQDAVSSVVEQVLESKARIALIGCGGLGMLIASELKKRGVIAIVLGGAIQVLFGIKGMRWATHSVISHFWNDAWVWPKAVETPLGASLIEGSCYWGKIEAVDI